MAQRKVIVVSKQDVAGEVKPYAQTIKAGPHTFSADAPDPPGNDNHPNPFDLLLSALGSCTSIWLSYKAKQNNWPLEKVHVELEIPDNLDYFKALIDGTTITTIVRKITLDGRLTDEQQRQLMQFANETPVYKALTGIINVITSKWP